MKDWSGLPERAIYLRPTMNNRAILEGATSLTPPSIAFSSIQFSTGKKNTPPPGGHVFQPTQTIVKLVHDINRMNLMRKFQEDRTINVAFRVLTRKNVPPPWWPCFSSNRNHLHTCTRYNWDNLTMFDDDRTINVASRVLTRFYYSYIMNNSQPPWRPCVLTNRSHFQLIQDITGTHLLTKFHEDRTINVLLNPGGHIFQATGTIFEHAQDRIGRNLQTKFHDDWKINVALRVLTMKNAPLPGGHVFRPTGIIFELVQDIIRMNLLTKKHAPPLGSHVFQANTILLTKFHEHLTINVASGMKNAPPPGGRVFQPTGIIFEQFKHIIGMNLLTKFHEDWTINVASRMLTRKNASPLGSHVFQANVTIFELIQDIIETNPLTKFHEDWTINVASSVLTRQILTPHNGRRTTDKRRLQKLDMSTLCSGELKSNNNNGKIIIQRGYAVITRLSTLCAEVGVMGAATDKAKS
ncbi:hypothetical protein DPMN_088778 [Dreissena polymorpha]|uniref:Uncharacterized protein n=1 Tax=Dreissena polymorpha TaxID=45954 RepID=A0A9D4KWH4_DREPO|nr:hypothetical protein DPMN_088778 [Dreissena polymorpha]